MTFVLVANVVVRQLVVGAAWLVAHRLNTLQRWHIERWLRIIYRIAVHGEVQFSGGRALHRSCSTPIAIAPAAIPRVLRWLVEISRCPLGLSTNVSGSRSLPDGHMGGFT
eukprot:CAMPEP_0174733544 /NCGR_PEP_ID=MMETSP1094-20130205/61528_1 /TAXON_ID=156173 /ORGANISM="Chrysochromulina brevifilum, Strain UTEX LB 985" /LENGTH=109 /DNA_ID=CAMNT_0015936223 /DNA_START=98 /DNA_END=428 /DNA_ORIENTATION=+